MNERRSEHYDFQAAVIYGQSYFCHTSVPKKVVMVCSSVDSSMQQGIFLQKYSDVGISRNLVVLEFVCKIIK